MKIGEVAARAGLKPSAIRFYEEAGLLPKPARNNGRRLYDPGAISRLALILFAQSGGFSLAEIRQLFSPTAGERAISARWKRLAAAKVVELDALIAKARAMKRELEAAIHCSCIDVDECGRAVERALAARKRA